MQRILIIKLGAFGDFIQALGPMQAIRKHHPDAHITLLTTKPFMILAQDSELFQAIHCDKRPKFYQLSGWLKLRNFFNDGQFDRVYDLQNNDRTNLYFKLFHPKPEWVGVAKGASHRNTSPERIAGKAFTGHQQTLALAGIENVTVDPLDWMECTLPDFDYTQSYALIVPGCAPQHPYKRWPAASYRALCDYLLTANITPVLIGTQAEEDSLQEIAAHNPDILNLCGQTKLDHLAKLARHAKLAVGNDTGPMHMIGPTGCPSLVLFSGHSQPHRHAPLGKNVQTLQKEPLSDLSVEDVIGLIEAKLSLAS